MADTETVADSLRGLATEGADPRYADIDRKSAVEIATLMNEADASVPRAIAPVLPAIATAVDEIVPRMERGGRIRYVGAGTAGRMAVIDASECPPTFSTSPDLVAAILAGGANAMTNAAEGAEDDEAAGIAAIDAADIGPDDTVIGVTASGRTPFVLAAVRAARARGALTIGLSCNASAPLSMVAEHPIEVVVGNELIAGSTRLKAGSAQKLVLNTISTITMIKLGRTFGNYMVDMRVLNAKLAARAAVMVSDITGATFDVAAKALSECDDHVKTAILMIERDLKADVARARLESHRGRLRDALAE